MLAGAVHLRMEMGCGILLNIQKRFSLNIGLLWPDFILEICSNDKWIVQISLGHKSPMFKENLELVSKELNHLADILLVYAGG